MDRVFIENLTIETVIGIFDWERDIRQAVSLDLEMDFDIRKAAASDAIEDTLDALDTGRLRVGCNRPVSRWTWCPDPRSCWQATTRRRECR